MIALLNPRRRRRKASKSSRRRRGVFKARRTRARRKCAGIVRRAVEALTCGKGAAKRWRSLRRRCRLPARVTSGGAPSHGGIAGIIAAGRAPGAIIHNRRRRRRSRNYSTWLPAYSSNPYWVPSYAMNPNGRPAVLSGFKPSVLMGALPYAAGAIGNPILSGFISGFMPDMLRRGWLNSLVQLASAGLLGAGAGMVRPAWASPVFMGGVFQVVYGAFTQLLGGMRGFSDYLSVGDAAGARPLFGMATPDFGMYAADVDLSVGDRPVEDISSNNDLSPEGMMPQNGFSDYLTVGDAAAARPLFGLGQQTMNDHVVEGTATDELSML